MDREVGPRVGNRTRVERNYDEDVDVSAYIERTPKTNEQVNREKSSAGWEYSFWTVVIIGVVIILLVLVIWFVFKKDDAPELQKAIQPGHAPNHRQNAGHSQQQPQQPHNTGHAQQQPHNTGQNSGQNPGQPRGDEGMAVDARANLLNRKTVKRNIGPVPGEIPDNPVVETEVKKVEETTETKTQVPDDHPEPLLELRPAEIGARLSTNLDMV
jgi:hypothetical protein